MRSSWPRILIACWLGVGAISLAGCVQEEQLLSDNVTDPDDDDPPPGDLSMQAPTDVSAEATGTATTVALGSPAASGGDGDYTFDNDAPAGGFALGGTTVTWTVTDGNDDTATDTQQVTLVDTTPPVIDDPADIQTVASGAFTLVTLAVPAVSDTVDSSPTVVNNQPSAGFPLGTTEVTWTATDSSGNNSTTLQYVTIVDGDPGGPLTVTAPANLNVEATGAITAVELGAASASGGMPPLALTNNAPAGGYPLGTTTVTWTVTDAGGMSATDTQVVRVADTTAPTLSVPGAITRPQSSSGGLTPVDLGSATATDIVDSSPTVDNDAPAGGFPVGTTTVTWTASDASGNSRSAPQQVTITAFTPESCTSLVDDFANEIYPLLDRTDPLTCNGCHTGPAPLATPNGFAFPNAPPGVEDFGVFRAVALLDAGGDSLVLVKARGGESHTGGDRFPAGNGDPDYLALADFVNRARGCEEDPPPPGELSLQAPDNFSGEATGPVTDVDLGEPEASGGDGQYTFDNDAPAGGFALGSSVVTWTVTDGTGDTATDTQQVTLVDTTPPVIDDPADIQTVATGEFTPVTLTVPAVSDTVDASPAVVNNQPAGGFPLGTTEVTWTATDASGNSATVLQFVTIVDDDPGSPLSLTAPPNRNVEATGVTTAVELGAAAASGGAPPLTLTNDAPAAGYPLGNTTVTWTVTDADGMSLTDTQIVRVADTTAPVLTVPGAITRTQSSSGGLTAVDLGTATASDLVDPSPTIDNNAPTGGFPVGVTTVTWTASDASGNSRSATQTVTITAFVPESCNSLVDDFADEIYPLLDRASPLTCNGCHTGPAPLTTPNGFAFPNSPPGAEDFEVFRAVAMLDAGGSSLVLVKARGGLSHTGGDRFPAGNGDPDYLALADFVNRARGCEEEPPGGTETVDLGTPYEQLHRIASVLASRPPTDDEIATVQGATDQASLVALLGPIIDGMQNEDAFYERVLEMYNDLLLTDQYATSTRNVSSNFALEAFAARNYYETYSGTTRDALRRDTNYGIARAPLELIRHVVRTDRPFTEILTATYTMVNPYSAVIYGVNAGDPNFPFSSDGVRANHDRDDFRPVSRIVQTAGDQSVVPPAGVLGTNSYLKRYPTTATNLNRKRARFTLMYFLGTDIEELAPRDALDLDNEIGVIPTYQDPQCTVCHDVMDPVAGLFTKYNNGGEYDIDIAYEWTKTRQGVQRMVPAGFGNTRVDASAQLPDAYLDKPLQWLGLRMAQDDRFAVQTSRKALQSLTGTDGESAQAVQFVNELKTAFIQSGYDFKALIKRIVTSDFFLAQNLAATENPAAYADLGTGRLKTPEELDRRVTAWLGPAYQWAGPATGSGLRGMHYLPYGGIDSDEIISRPASPTALIDGIQERIANQVACERVARDLANGGPLFPDAGVTDTPDTTAGRTAIRANIRHLHRYLLGEDLAANDPEIETTYQLFVDARALNETNIPTQCRGGGGTTDTQRTVLPWMAVVTYLLGDYRFVYD